jgi:hypothetical protein
VAGEGDVGRGDARDALVVDVAGHDPRPEGDHGDDGGLGPGVEALHVGGGVALGVAQALGLGQRLLVRGAVLGHAGQDEIGGAVDDAGDPGDALAGQRLAQRPDQRDGARHRRFEQDVDAGGVGHVEDLGADVGQQLLVGADDGLARLEGVEGEGAGGLDAADHLHDHVDGRVVDHGAGVVGDDAFSQLDRAGLGHIAHRHPGHLEAQAGAGVDVVAPLVDQLDQRRAHVAAAQDTDVHVRVVHEGQR